MTGARSGIESTKLDAVEELFGGSELGRAFLDGLGKAQRDDDLVRIFKSLEKLEAHTGAIREEARIDAFREELKSMSEAILQTRGEIAAIQPDSDSSSRIMAATEELDAITTATERATSDILGAAERIQAATQGMREGGIDDRICVLLDDQATNIFMACSFQDITGQRVQKVVNLLRYLEQRINAMVGLWVTEHQDEDVKSIADLQFNPLDTRPDADLLSGPAKEGTGVSQDDVDRMMGGESDAPVEAPVSEPEVEEEALEPVAEAAPEPVPEPEVAEVPSEETPVAAVEGGAPVPAGETPAAEIAETKPEATPAAEAAAPADDAPVPETETVNQDDIDAMFG